MESSSQVNFKASEGRPVFAELATSHPLLGQLLVSLQLPALSPPPSRARCCPYSQGWRTRQKEGLHSFPLSLSARPPGVHGSESSFSGNFLAWRFYYMWILLRFNLPLPQVALEFLWLNSFCDCSTQIPSQRLASMSQNGSFS